MRANDLTPGQLAALKAQVGRQLRYLNRLCDRMSRRGFAPFDGMFQDARNAAGAAGAVLIIGVIVGWYVLHG